MLSSLAGLACMAGCLWAQAPLYLGVVEFSGTGSRVRVAFEFRNEHWTPMPQNSREPAGVSWTIALDGRKLEPPPPRIREGAKKFENWLGTPPFRPLVVVSQANFRDPDRWKPFRAPAAMLGETRVAFEVGKVQATCQGEPVEIRPERDLRLVPEAYRSAQGYMLLALKFDIPKDVGEGIQCETIWFLRKGDGFHYVGAGLALLDAGDYDADGTSEIIFAKSGYNLDGYVLLSVKDASTQSFVWTYH
jgi:hypothetical protein